MSHPQLTPDELAFLQHALDLARDGSTAELVAMVEAGLPVNLTGGSGDSLLVLAAYHRHGDTVEALLRLGADHTRVNDRGQTALGCAVFRQDERSVRALLDAGADPSLGRQSAWAVAEVFELPEMTALLRAASDAEPPRQADQGLDG